MGDPSRSPQRRIGVMLVLVAACANEVQPRRATWTRRTSEAAASIRWDATAFERFGVGAGAVPHGSSGGHAAASAGPSAPDGWIARDPGSMHRARFDVPGGASCTWTELPGEAGGLLANVNRWREQIGLTALDEAGLGELSRVPWGSEEALLIEHLDTAPALLGLITIDARGSRFLKMQGPSDAVRDARDAFLEFAAGVDSGTTVAPATASAVEPGQAGPLSFDVPAGWVRGDERPMRLATWNGEGWELSLTILNGDGGGLSANVGRWYEQLDRTTPTDAEIDALATLAGEIGEATVVDLTGSYRGMMGESLDDAAMLGAIQIGTARSIFVKAIGRKDAMDALRPDFEAFYASLREMR